MRSPVRHALPQRAHIARYLALLMFVVIVFTSLYPFTGWSYSGRPLLEFLSYPLPYYFRLFDNVVNLLVYVPYGFALALSFRPRWLGWLLALLLSALTSFMVELGQEFLPERIASNLDILYNVAGAVIGATLAVSPLFRRAWHHIWRWRQRYFVANEPADYALALMAIWFITQLNPSVPLFGVVVMPLGLPQPFISPIANPALFLFMLEAGGAMLHLIATLLFVTSFLSKRRYIARSVATVIVLAGFLKMLAAGMLLKPFAFFEWINSNVLAGLGAGFLLVWLITRFGRGVQLVSALLAILATQLISALWPLSANERDMLALFRWNYGHLANMNALVDFLSHLWPLAATLCLVGALWNVRRMPSMQTKSK